ncbi:MAG: NAD(P)/FAD-dependent oxidoreductase [Clostridia bacterium]|nr:NAD(P)/FAD-dependent oxidoreductase [Clostridia bacterium]
MKRIVVIGGGAAGLMAAIRAAQVQRDAHITVLERNSRPARKIMITGKGRCNVTNNCDIDTLIANVSRNGKFLYSAFNTLSAKDTYEQFENWGVPLKTERGNRVFPVSDKAVDIVDALVNNAKKNCRIIEGRAESIEILDGKVCGVKLQGGEFIGADSVILATGGMSYSVTGSTGDGYKMAESLGHTVTEIKPSLIPLECHEGFCSRLSGLTLKNVTLSLFEEGRKKPVFSELGEMLFTHFGISGPLVLSASAHIKDIDKKSYKAVIDLKPALTAEQLDKRILRDFEGELNKDFSNSLDALLPKSLIPVIVSLSKIPADTKVNQVSREDRWRLVELLKGFTLRITGTRPIEEAIITRGGIPIKEINSSTMESKIVKGLYFAGEIIDVDAYTGGFNLQIAFSTGYLAGESSVKEGE